MKSLYSSYFYHKYLLHFFDREIENLFWDTSYDREIFLYRIAFITSLVIPLFYSFLDWYITKDTLPSIVYFRLFVTCPLIIISILVSYIPFFKNAKSLQFILFFSLLSIGISYIIYTLFFYNNQIFAVNSTIAILLIGSALFNLKMVNYIILDLSFVLTYFIFLIQNDLSISEFLSDHRLLLIFALLTIFIKYGTEKNRRIQFLKSEILKAQNQEIVLQKNELEQLNKVKDKLFSIIAHDLKHPLDSLKGVLILLKAKALSQDEINLLIENLENEIKNTTDLLSNLLNWAKAHLKGIEAKKEKFNLTLITNEVVKLLKPQADKKEIRIINSVDKDLFAFADIEMAKFVLRNLVSNAIKFTNKGEQICISEKRSNDWITLTIEDSGIGINNEILKKIFTDSMPSTKGTAKEIGTGLGLILSKEFIEKNDGAIWVNSKVGKGSKFSFKLKNYIEKN